MKKIKNKKPVVKNKSTKSTIISTPKEGDLIIPKYRMVIFTYYQNPSILKIEQNKRFEIKRINNNIKQQNSNIKQQNSNIRQQNSNIKQQNSNIIQQNSNNRNHNSYGYNRNNNFKNNNNNVSNNKRFNAYNISSDNEQYKQYKDSNNQIVFYNDKKLYNNKINEKVHYFEYSDIGLANIGNSCYMNAFLQILLHTPNFLYYLSQDKYKIQSNKNTLLFNLLQLSQYPFNSQYLYNIKNIMKETKSEYGTFNPGDSQMFAIDFLDKLIYECKGEVSNDDSYESNYGNLKISKKEKYNKFSNEFNKKDDEIEKLFQFTEISTGKEKINYTFSITLNIELTFPKNNQKYITLNKLLDEKYLNNNEYTKIVRIKRTQIADIPEILIITFDRGVINKEVIKTNVSFNDNLDIAPYIDSELKEYNNIKCTEYILYGINERYGYSKTQGHYVSYAKIKNCNWYRFSDLYVSESNPSFNSQDVFGLYYVRKDSLSKK